MLTALTFGLIIFTAVLIHELAHYLNAKSVGLQVRAFSVGFGPILWRRQWRGTEWRLSLIPLGGYVDIPGMTPTQDELGNLSHPEDGFATKTLAEKLWVLVGGVLANALLAVILFAVVISVDPLTRTGLINPDAQLTSQLSSVMPDSRAAELGLLPGDILIDLNGQAYPTPDVVVETIQEANRLELTVERGEQILTFATPWPPEGVETPLLGIGLGAVPTELVGPISFPRALVASLGFTARIIPQTVSAIGTGFVQAFSGRQSEDIAGPVRLVGIANQATKAGLVSILFLAAGINLSLAVFNILPIPGLDGGRMLLATIVALRGKPFKPGQEEFVHFLGIMAVLAFMVLITFNEIGALFTRS